MEQIEQMTGLSAAQISRYGLFAGIALVTLGLGQHYITCLLGVAYPVFMSFLALESDSQNDDRQWLTYWVTFGVVQCIDNYAGFILHFIPFYYFLKMAFLVWLFHPSTQGATFIYTTYIREQGLIADAMMSKAATELGESAEILKEKAMDQYDAVKEKVTGSKTD